MNIATLPAALALDMPSWMSPWPTLRLGTVVGVLLCVGCAGMAHKPPTALSPPDAPTVTGGAATPRPAPPALPTAAAPAKPPVQAPVAAAPAKSATPAAAAVKPQAAPPLDLKTLESRLKQTPAIGVFTKLTLKNQIDALLDQFRAFYQGKLKISLAELRRSYDMLVLKVLALLQDADPPLASAIAG
jgi:hypothetical protein